MHPFLFSAILLVVIVGSVSTSTNYFLNEVTVINPLQKIKLGPLHIFLKHTTSQVSITKLSKMFQFFRKFFEMSAREKL